MKRILLVAFTLALLTSGCKVFKSSKTSHAVAPKTETTAEKNKIFSQNFSYIGNQNNPPDLIIRNGDAIEIKKIENLNSAIALNSSYPKAKLHADSPMITKSCRECEDWREKDILYVIGVVAKENILKSLWFVYGDCYAAEKEIYEKIKNTL